MKGKGGIKRCLPICWFYPVGLDYFWNWGSIRKRLSWNRRLRLLFVLGFQESSIYNLHLCFSLDITKWCKVYTKADSWFQKSQKFEQLHRSSGKSKKFKFDGLLSKKYIPSAKRLYREDLSYFTFNYLCENSPSYLCHFWNRKSFFSSSVLFRTFYKSIPSKR